MQFIMADTRFLLVIFLLSFTLVRGDELRFLVIGDWGGIPFLPYTTPYETAVSKGMGKIAEQLGTQFTVALGRKYGFYCLQDCRIITTVGWANDVGNSMAKKILLFFEPGVLTESFRWGCAELFVETRTLFQRKICDV